MNKNYYVYILTNSRNNVLYTGVTGRLWQRVEEHFSGKGARFTSAYNLSKLVYAEEFSQVEEAIFREKQIKAGSRKKKIALIEKNNPSWANLKDWS